MSDPSASPNQALGVSLTWAQYTAPGAGLTRAELTRNGKLPRKVVLLAAGNLVCTDAYGEDASLTGLPLGYEHTGAVGSIGATQDVSLVIYW